MSRPDRRVHTVPASLSWTLRRTAGIPREQLLRSILARMSRVPGVSGDLSDRLATCLPDWSAGRRFAVMSFSKFRHARLVADMLARTSRGNCLRGIQAYLHTHERAVTCLSQARCLERETRTTAGIHCTASGSV